ncbi:MAG: phosphate ABC transporter substrate-binding protein PstS [Thermoplasmata archaeon]
MSATSNPSTPAASADSVEPRPVVQRRRGRTGLYAALAVIVVIVIVVAVGAATSWYGLQTSSTPTKGTVCTTGVTLQGNGAQFVNPLLTAWTSAFATATSNQVNYVDGGSGTGLTDFSEHPPLIDFAITDDPLTAAEQSAMPGQALTLPFAGGALTIIYDLPGVAGHLNMTGTVLAGIYNGSITKWNDPAIAAINHGVTLPGSTIIPVVRSDPAGTTYVLTDFLSQSSAWWNSNIGKGISVDFSKYAPPSETAVKGNSLVLSTVAKTSYAIGYSDLTDVLTYSTTVQYAGVLNPLGNYVVPTIANTASAISDKVASLASIPASSDTKDWFNVSMVNARGATDYPLATFVYLYVYQDTSQGYEPTLTKSQVIVQWLDYILSPGAQAMTGETSPAQLYYTALPAAVVSVDQTGISTMTFNGAAIPACT